MARAAKLLREFVSVHLAGIEDAFVLKMPGLHCRNVVRTWPMARFASYSGYQAIQLQLTSVSRCRGVTRKAITRLIHADPSARRYIERWRDIARIANGDIQTLDIFVEADAAFVERTIVPEDVGLARLPLAKCVEYRLGNCVNAIGYRVQALVAAAHDLMGVGSATVRHPPICAQNFARCYRLKSATHGCQVLFCRFFRVTLRAGFRPGIGGVFFTGTPRR